MFKGSFWPLNGDEAEGEQAGGCGPSPGAVESGGSMEVLHGQSRDTLQSSANSLLMH